MLPFSHSFRESFDVQPIGPVGQHLKLSDPELEDHQFGQHTIGDAVETLLGRETTTFLVATLNDQHKLRAILNQNRKRDVNIVKVPFFEPNSRQRKRRFEEARLVRSFLNPLVDKWITG